MRDHEYRRFLADHPGTPLGKGYPSGATLRLDGETHRQAWRRLLMRDPCSYCGISPAMTVDHIEPKDPLKTARGIGGKHDWTNLVGSCLSCNGHKGSNDLLSYLRTRYPVAAVARSSVVGVNPTERAA